jgi:hypothetical protein
VSSWIQSLADNAADKGVTAFIRALDRHRIVNIMLIAFCAVAALGGVGFIAVGVYVSLCESLSAWLSGLIVGGAILLPALIAMLILRYSMRNNAKSQARPSDPGPAEMESAQVDNITHLGEVVGSAMSKRGVRTTDVMIAALVAGTVLGAAPALRRRRHRQHPRRHTHQR